FAVAHVTSKVANLFGAGIPAHGYTRWHQHVTFFTAPLFAFAAVLCGFFIARRHVRGRFAPTSAALAILYGTSLTAYATYLPWSSHPPDALAAGAMLALWALTLGDLGRRRWLAVGALTGVAGLMRTASLSIGIVVVVEVVWLQLAQRNRRARLRICGYGVSAGAAARVAV